MKTDQKSAYGSCRAYTRHLRACPHRHEKNYNICTCPKWLYVHPRDAQDRRYSLQTPSWGEAQEIAKKTLEGLNPEVAAARKKVEERQGKMVDIEKATKQWLDNRLSRTESEGSKDQWRATVKKFREWAAAQGIRHIHQITTAQLDDWYSSSEWTDYAPSTRKQRWVMTRMMFRYWVERGLIEKNPILSIKPIKTSGEQVQGPYSEKQVEALLQEVVGDARLRAFVLLLLNTGCDVVDAVVFEPSRIQDERIAGVTVPIYRYRRRKRGSIEAVIPLTPEVAKSLRTVPLGDGNSAAMPFRNPGIKLREDTRAWSRLVRDALSRANVKWVILPVVDENGYQKKKQANCKQFRHTFAVRELVAGQRPEEVARELGHVDTEMVRKHYAPWVKDMDRAHVARILAVRGLNGGC